MASLILLIVLAVYCIWLLRHMAKRRKEKHGKCVDCPYSRIWVQTVDEDGFPAYAEDTVK